MQNVKRNIILTLIFAFLVYIVLLFYSDFNSLLDSVEHFSLNNFFLAFLFSILALIVKFYKWHFLLNQAGININFLDSFLIFCSGLIMSITPGKVGEVFKSYLIKKKYDIEISKSIPVIILERLSEIISLFIINFIILIILDEYPAIIFSLAIFLLLLMIFLLNTKFTFYLEKIIGKISFLKFDINKTLTFLPPKKNLVNVRLYLISIFAWIFEFFCFFIILSNFNNSFQIIKAISFYSLSILFGSVSMLPGGLGSTESSLTYLLFHNGLIESNAIAVTILIRIFTLWLSVIIGFFSIYFYLNKGKTVKLNKNNISRN